MVTEGRSLRAMAGFGARQIGSVLILSSAVCARLCAVCCRGAGWACRHGVGTTSACQMQSGLPSAGEKRRVRVRNLDKRTNAAVCAMPADVMRGGLCTIWG